MSTEYNADQIQILEGLEAVRKRPGMYIGSTSSRGLHHLVYEIVDNSVDEALAGFCSEINVTVHPDNSVTVLDNGRGIPVDIQKKAGISALEVVFTILHAGGKFGGGGYKVSGGLHGVGASVVNALSSRLEVNVYRDGKIYQEVFAKGKVIGPVTVVGDCDPEKHGTEVTFLPDPEIFEETVYDYDTLKIRLRETAFLTKNLKITLNDEREDPVRTHTFHYEGGIREFVTYLNRGKSALYNQVIYCEGVKDKVIVEVALQHNDSFNESIYTFVNNINTPEGGTHLTGFRNAVTKTFNDYARTNKLLKDNEDNLSGEDLREGMTAIVSVKVEDPQFEGQTKQKLGNSEASGAVNSIVSEQITYFLEQNPAVAKVICEKAILAMGLDNCAVNCDFIMRDGKTYVLEIGGRSGATCLAELVSIYYGYDYYKKIIEVALGQKPDFPKDKAVPNASKLLMSDKDGEIIALANRNPKSDSNICEVCFDYTIGDQVKKFHVGPNRIGHVVTKGRTLAEATAALDRALKNIEIEVV